jgi:hypothetical protein
MIDASQKAIWSRCDEANRVLNDMTLDLGDAETFLLIMAQITAATLWIYERHKSIPGLPKVLAAKRILALADALDGTDPREGKS